VRYDGALIELDGSTPILIPGLAEGNYYVIIQHRNHLDIMSSVTIPLTYSGIASYDFTTGQDQAYGLEPMIMLDVSLYGMVSGDSTFDGMIDASDIIDVWNARNWIGYFYPDVSLDTMVDANDIIFVWNNRNRTTLFP